MVPGTLRVWLAMEPVNMVKSIDALAAVVVEHLKKDPKADGVFVFVNSKKDRAKLLWRDTSGWCLLYKRLDVRVVALPDIVDGKTSISLDGRALAVLLEGVERVRKERDLAKKSRARALSAIEVETPPGCTTLTLTGSPPRRISAHSDSVKPRTANFEAQ